MTEMEAWVHFAGQALAGILASSPGERPDYATQLAAQHATEMLEHYQIAHLERTNFPVPKS